MSTFYNAQICKAEESYKIQFETNDYEYFKMVEKACQNAIDKKEGEQK